MATQGRGSVDAPERLNALHQLGILDSEPEEAFESIVRLARTLFRVEYAGIHVLDERRQWVKAPAEGGIGSNMPVGEAICRHTIERQAPLVVLDLSDDERFRDNRFVAGAPFLRFYAGFPLPTDDGHVVGTLCLMDPAARVSFTEHEARVLRQLADVVIHAMELRGAHDQARRNLMRAVEEDALTGLMSRRGLLMQLQRVLGSEPDPVPQLGMVKIHLGRLDLVRRGYGTAVSNRLLQDAAERIRASCTAGELLARLDGRSFLIARMFSGTSRHEQDVSVDAWAGSRASGVLVCLDEAFRLDGNAFHLVPSAGIARSPTDGVDAYALLDVVDEAVLHAEESGGVDGRIRWNDADARSVQRRRLSLEQRLREAVAGQEFTLAYQPIVDLQNGAHTLGAEALLRWPQEDGTRIGPDLFVPLAEELRLIQPLGFWVFETACRALRAWQDETGRDLWVSVNLSPLQLHEPDLPRRLVDMAAQAGVAPTQVKLEITESALIEGFDMVAALLNELAEAGFPLALDDFGTGHSSLSRLIHLPFSLLKVDRAFVWDSPRGPGAAVVASLSGLAQSLALDALGEGIETEGHETFLRSQAYRLGQGFRYARPLAPEAFLGYIRGA